MNELNVAAVVLSWVDASDENAALQWLPSDAPEGDGTYSCPTLYVGNSTGETIRQLIHDNQISDMSVILDAPSYEAPTYTLISHLEGTGKTNNSIVLYTHSDGPSIIEENGPIMLLTLAEYFSRNLPFINLDLVMTTGHLSGDKLNESDWMGQRPDLMANAYAEISIEHFGAIEWKDVQTESGPVYTATGWTEPMWTFANGSSESDAMRSTYLEAFEGSPDYLRMALLQPLRVNGVRSKWYGVGGASKWGYSDVPSVGIIPQPDYLWASMIDGGYSKYDHDQAVAQLEVIIRAIKSLDQQFCSGQ
ncbi:uncharacterized protein B0I36DRAFT_274844 [Microdochium trichocladiopsis]|uniref:Uncharacterized protein n=1 Tax=Microdochium trichocladiopsis TaxID=1682393 RepID=A0A9P8Y0S4_9PEZI|nr:uncharacterized protein B0I36DRAFT_274844 [Microdochium trichocladiopsis]KAH7025123.1 hypothetical protein B0I36DRAFT_274844 [Microdochium trichocladiopsis]